jgi:hypothetical protein
MSDISGGNSRIPIPKRENVINIMEPDDLKKVCEAVRDDMKEVFDRLDRLEAALSAKKDRDE